MYTNHFQMLSSGKMIKQYYSRETVWREVAFNRVSEEVIQEGVMLGSGSNVRQFIIMNELTEP